ncbi:MAG: HupE/UreJ family protein [Steroidobacteraceae bacterium]
MTLWRAILAALLLALGATPALAHTKSATYSVWRVEGKSIQLSFTIPLQETKRLARDNEDQPPNDVVFDYLKKNLGATAGGKDCALQGQVRALTATSQFRRFSLNFSCPSEQNIVLHTNAFFELVPSHVSLAQIEVGEDRFFEHMFTDDARSVPTAGDDEEMREAGFLDYVRMGIMHIFTGVDHMSFLLGLVLISRRLRDLIFVVTGFTLGHSATLALAVTGIFRPHAEYIDALVALTIAMVGAENIAVATHRPGRVALWVGGTLIAMSGLRLLGVGLLPAALLFGAGIFAANYFMLSGHLRDAARLRLVVTLVFGLIHGFGFASDLLQLQLPTGKLAMILVGFNCGVEVGQLTVVLVLTGLTWLLVRARLALPRPIVVDTVSAGLVGLGLYWFITRSYTF